MSCDTPKDCCSAKPNIETRPLLSPRESAELEALFKVLGNQTRLRMLHALTRAREICVTDLADALEMKPQAISNQLQRLVDKGMVASRRNGNNIFYRIVDPCVVSLLDSGLCLMEDAKERAGLNLPISPTQNLHAEQIR
jgi:ArsR family transcriptional regulator, lead/cadmium/zinc/bismuth-responsive transcriptional repressor